MNTFESFLSGNQGQVQPIQPADLLALEGGMASDTVTIKGGCIPHGPILREPVVISSRMSL
jgi:hypothetical protein